MDPNAYSGIAQIITAMGVLVTALTSMFALFASRANARNIAVVGQAVHEVHLATNSMKDELVRSTAADWLAKGRLEGHAEGKAEGEALALGLKRGQDEKTDKVKK
jgi:hypothetical protein